MQQESRRIWIYAIIGAIVFGPVSYYVYAKDIGFKKDAAFGNAVETQQQPAAETSEPKTGPKTQNPTTDALPSPTSSASQQPSAKKAVSGSGSPSPAVAPPAAPVSASTPPQPSSSQTVTLTGIVMQKTSGSGFVIQADGKNYTVTMDPYGGTRVVNQLGHLVPWQFIQVGNSVTVTGPLDGSAITATTIAIPTTKDT